MGNALFEDVAMMDVEVRGKAEMTVISTSGVKADPGRETASQLAIQSPHGHWARRSC
jgi:hypothetical protein